MYYVKHFLFIHNNKKIVKFSTEFDWYKIRLFETYIEKALFKTWFIYQFENFLSKISISKLSCYDVLITKLPAALCKSTHQRAKKVYSTRLNFWKYYSMYISIKGTLYYRENI